MKRFYQWHDENEIFYREQKIDFCHCDANHNIKLSNLLALCSDAAVEDYLERGLDWKFLKEKGFAILTSRLALRFFRLPKAGEILRITTWEEKSQGLQLYRAYEVDAFTRDKGLSSEPEKLASGISAWLVVNPETRRIIKPALFDLRKEPTVTNAHNCLDCGKIAMPQNLVHFDTRTVRYSDLDGNAHVNNARYGDFVMDSLPEEYRAKTITDFRLNYAHEAVLGDELVIDGAIDEGANKIVLVAKQDANTCFEAELFFK